MSERITHWLRSPLFPGDERKTMRARIMSIMSLLYAGSLVLAAAVFVPFFAVHKAESLAIILTLGVLLGIARWLMFRGRLAASSALVLVFAWLIFSGTALFSAGILSPLQFAVAACVLVTSLLLEPRIGRILMILSVAAGLALALLQQGGVALPQLLRFSPMAAWFLFALSIFLTSTLMNLTVRSLEDALTRADQQHKNLRQTEQALRRSENRFQMFMEHFPGLAYIKDSDGRIVFANEGFQSLLGIDPRDMPGRTNEEVFGPAFGSKISRDDRRVLESGIAEDIEESFGGRYWTTYKFVIDQPEDRPLLAGVTIDTSSRKRAEEALAQSRGLMRAILDGTSDLIWSVDSERFGLINWNRAFEEYFRKSRGIAVGTGMRPEELFPAGSDLVLLWNGYYRKALTEGPFTTEFRVSADTILLLGLNVFAQGGRPVGISVFGKDITDRTHAEAALHESEELFRALFQQAGDLIFIIDPTAPGGAVIVDANQSACRTQGLDREELVGMPIADLDDVENRPLAAQRIARVMAGEHLVFEAVHVRKDGVSYPAEISAKAVQRAGKPPLIFAVERDISERKRAEAALRKSERKFSKAFHGSSSVFSISTLAEGRFLDVNERFLETLGYSREQVIGRTVFELGLWSDPLQAGKLRDLLRERGSVSGFESRYRRKSGDIGYGLLSAAVIDIDGTPCLLTETVDITDRKLAEQALAESEAHLRYAAEAAEFGTFAWDFATGHGVYSAEFLALYGLPPGAALPLDEDLVPAALHPGDRPAFLDAMRRASEPGGSRVLDLEYRITRTDGLQRWLRMRGRTTFAGPGGAEAPIRAHGVAYDITAHKNAAEQMELLKSSIDHAPDAAYWIDPEGRFIYVNDAGCSALGYSREEMLRMHVGEINPRATPERWASVWQIVKAQGSITLQSEHRRRDGTTFPVELSSSYFRYGDREYCNGYARDLTEHLRAEAEREALRGQLAQAQRMESIGRLAGGVAHDFNNMLGVIMGHADIALGRLASDDPLYEEVDAIRKATERSADLTRQLLAFARKQTIAPKVLDLNEVVEKMLKMLRRLIGEHIELSWQPAAALWMVRIDPAQLDQVLANLCVNSRDAITGTGRITIQTRNVTFDQEHCTAHPECLRGEWVLLTVSDDGRGMDAKTITHVFEPFFTTKGVGKGTGLGLATVYGVVKQNDGFITVTSEPGRGTSFFIHLPRQAGVETGAFTEARHEPVEGDGETVLIVEDEPMILQLAATMLRRLGYSVLSGRTPGEAIRLAKAHANHIHLVMTDIVMPEMNGRELAERLKGLCPGLKCLYTSGYTADVIATNGVLEEGVHFLQKPYSLEQLAAAVREAVRG